MTPFGARIRSLRQARGVTLKQMAADIGVSAAYLSALEHGHRGRPSWLLLQRICGYLNIIWDDAEELAELAKLSHPRVTIDTAGLSPKATLLANELSRKIASLDDSRLDQMLKLLRG
ncbi:helix-turn-helix domain-containing protein [uncultured Ferrovibrio sp.]|jgi:transcriptional regulator with XRE-family HTH domain|uniref:helix-turn-helix domain-containing protein n=1 Tax=uncultured Ferrovibrio sp. TaxID=1576913 RepID=UPI00261342D5|nr:helix-turn-helix domain-containing protein [uncultured Ferrovibrio sp.]